MSPDSKAADPPDDEPALRVAGMRENPGIRTHVLLVVAMALVIGTVTSLCLLLIRHRLRAQVTDHLSQDLDRSVSVFQNLQAERLGALERENALLAELPTLKALMTSGDDLTIQEGTVEFWQLSGNDLFALADASGRVVAAYTKGVTTGDNLRQRLTILLAAPGEHYLIDGRSLYACSVRPLFFGSEEGGTLLGYVVSGVSMERTVRQISQPTGVEAAFLSSDRVVASTLEPSVQANLETHPPLLSGTPRAPATVKLGNERFLAATENLSANATSPLQLVVLKSFGPAEQSIKRIDRMVLIAGFLALLSGTGLMIALSRLVTGPLEELSRSVRAFGVGDGKYRIPRHGTQEVRQLSTAFAGMRSEIQQANRDLLESERLATIGRMASSISHDLRHYLASVYANAEFLASDRLSAKERAEIFVDIRAAVLGTTDMLESLLIFSRTGTSARKSPELVASLIERTAALMRSHPDAEGVTLVTHCGDPADTEAVVDGKQIERAIYNLLLNACQSARATEAEPNVLVTLETQDRHLIVRVVDNGAGVPENIRGSLLEPFVSEGKHKGTGLGLTLAHCIAVEHGGEVTLLSSRPGETIFQMNVERELRTQDTTDISQRNGHHQVLADENVRL